MARCLLAIQEDDDDDISKGVAIVPAEEMMALEGGRSADDGCSGEAGSEADEELHATTVVDMFDEMPEEERGR